MPDPQTSRWSDSELERFHAEFLEHDRREQEQLNRHDRLYEVVFRKEDRERGVYPGLMQLCSRMSDDIAEMKKANDRQKRFIGGVIFAFTSMAFFLSETFSRLLEVVRRL